ncbi:TBC1 domain family member 30 [Merluccius polli]|uniref:TBC1 domain family member 30 n=1 Tax=Merluccius polli TaxID=89951 RepID=A0AA47NTZ9_MERPO|nr:TBC1 domain family member 30 [Merluccius polli]
MDMDSGLTVVGENQQDVGLAVRRGAATHGDAGREEEEEEPAQRCRQAASSGGHYPMKVVKNGRCSDDDEVIAVMRRTRELASALRAYFRVSLVTNGTWNAPGTPSSSVRARTVSETPPYLHATVRRAPHRSDKKRDKGGHVKKMASQLSDAADAGDRGESGVVSVNAATSLSDDDDFFSAFQQWRATEPARAKELLLLLSDTSSSSSVAAARAQQVPDQDLSHGTADDGGGSPTGPRASIVDRLLVELYDACGGGGGGMRGRHADSLDSSTEASGSDAFPGRSNTGSNFLQELQERHTRRHQMNYLAQKAPEELSAIIQEVKYRTGLQSAKLLRQLKRRDRLHHKLQKNSDIITACLQAERFITAGRRSRAYVRSRQQQGSGSGSAGVGTLISNVLKKRNGISRSAPRLLCTLEPGVDTRLKFSIEPSLAKNGFQQWYDALKSVARLPTGIPKEWRKRVWLTLADQYLHSISIDWEKTLRFAFNERSNPDDDSLGIQIVKDLHRTGCSSYCGQEGEQDRVVLKRVLLAYARWNKTVGYCQGFNVLAALILEVTEGSESDALKVMIYLIDKVLPENYFANNLQALSVDMAVFRDLLRLKLPRLSQHLHHLQKAANKEAGGSYEPPLTNVFTMQWFLTMFATCLPPQTVLKIWDSVFFEGSEVLLRVALAIWERLGERIEYCQSADEFYSTMGCLTQEMLEHSLIHSTDLMQEVYSMAVFPFPQLAELREKYTYNITPFPTSVKSNGSGGLGSWESDEDADMDDEDSVVTALGCLGPLGGLLAPELQRYQKHLKDQHGGQGNMAELSPGAVGAGGGLGSGRGGGGGGVTRGRKKEAVNGMMMERMSTDIGALKRQYARIKRRQQQQAMQLCIRTDKCPATSVLASQLNPSSPVVNHLLLGRKPRSAPRTSTPSSFSGLGLPSTLGGAGGGGSPWRAHVRAHRRGLARARAQLGFVDSEDLEDNGEKEEEEEEEERRAGRKYDELGGSKTERGGEGVAEAGGVNDDEEEVEEENGLPASLSPGSTLPGAASEEAESTEGGESGVEERLGSLDLAADSQRSSPTGAPLSPAAVFPTIPPETQPQVPVLRPPPPQPARRRKGSDSPTSSSPPGAPPRSSVTMSSSPSTPALSSSPLPSSCRVLLPSSPSTPDLGSILASSCSSSSSACTTPTATKMPLFSPFPCVKQPRKSVAARNLGLYGPTARTPAVHFPQLSRSAVASAAAAATAETTGRRR